MSTIATVADVLAALETDLPDSVLQRYLDTAEDDIRAYLPATNRTALPVVVWTGKYTPILGEADGSLTLPSSIRGYPLVRFEGTVAQASETPSYAVDTDQLQTAESGTATITPVVDDVAVAAGAYDVAIDDTGLILTVDTSATTAAVTITRILGLQTAAPPARYLDAVLSLVEISTRPRGIASKRVGQYGTTFMDPETARFKVLGRLVYASDESILY